jgi:Cof subfamily protein (haloacid dehalogenase superfamily)
MPSSIELIALDIDGTLLNNAHELTRATEDAIHAAMATGVRVIIATGKTRYSAHWILERLGLTMPGVFIQGLVICNADGSILHETVLPSALVSSVLEILQASGMPVIAYRNMGLITNVWSPAADTLISFHEPTPIVVPIIPHDSINKLIVMDDPARLTRVRATLASALNGSAALVQSLPQFLEVVPANSSKGSGVKWVLDYLGIPPANMLAIGDGENDVEMLRLAGIGAAVENAMPAAKEAADVVIPSNNEDGVAAAIHRYVLESTD